MARMIRTIISLQEEEKKWLDAYGRRHGISSAQAVRLAIREFHSRMQERPAPGTKGVRDGNAGYGPPGPQDIADMADLKRRAAAAAGRFASGVPDLSVEHDRYLAAEMSERKRSGHEAEDGERGERPAAGRSRRAR